MYIPQHAEHTDRGAAERESFLYAFAATAFGLLISAFVSTQVAAIYATSIAAAMTAAHYSGFLFSASSLEGMGRMMGLVFGRHTFGRPGGTFLCAALFRFRSMLVRQGY